MANAVESIEPPALPLAGYGYDRSKQDQTNNILRLFFNRLTNIIRNLLSVSDNGGRLLYFPRGTFLKTTAGAET